MLFILAIPIIIIAALLFWAGWKKSALAIIIAPFIPAAALMLALNSNQNPEIGEGLERVDWLPPKATNVSFIRSYSFTAYEFTIDEAGFKKFAESRDWPILEFNEKKEVA